MIKREDEQTDLGIIKIKDDAISSVALIAASEVEGVKTIGKDFKSRFFCLFGKERPAAIKVNIDKNQEVEIKIPIIVKYGFNIPDVANRVQENVRNALERMTNLSLKSIDIVVQEIEKG